MRIGIVNYLNSKPFLVGLQSKLGGEIDLITDCPANLADMLYDGKIDIGLIPIVEATRLGNYKVIGNYCIGSLGGAASVCLFSEVEIKDIEYIYIDYQSRTSVVLLKWLIENHWKINPTLIETSSDEYISKISGSTAGLIIGDRALVMLQDKNLQAYDLSFEWNLATGLPFVFAAWISKKEIEKSFAEKFDSALEYGLTKIDEIISEANFKAYNLKFYFSNNLSFKLNSDLKKGMKMFLDYASKI